MNASERVETRVIAEQAQAWFITNREREPTARQQREFLTWLQASPAHLREYLAFAKLDLDLHAVAHSIDEPLEQLIRAARNQPDDNVRAFSGRSSAREASTGSNCRSRAAFLTIRRMSLIAAGVAAFGFATLAWWSTPNAPPYHEYRTEHGEQRNVRLDDGSMLHVNSESIVRVHYNRSERAVVVEHGQAMFRVAKDARRPFRVRAGATEVVAVGTQFDVRRFNDDVLVTVVEGSVAVAKLADPGLEAATTTPLLQLAAGQQARVANGVLSDLREVDVRAIDVRPAVAWVQQQIMFEHETLQNIVAEFNRYGRMQLTIEDAQLATLRISGVFNTYDLDSFVLYLETLKGLKVEREANRIRIVRARSVGETT